MGRLAIIGGTSTRHTRFAATARRTTTRGVTMLDPGDWLFLDRHGPDRPVPAHRIDHVANALALADAGVDRAVGLASSASLRPDWPVGTVVCPDDFYAPQVTVSLHDDLDGHSVPGFDPAWRAVVVETWRASTATALVDHGVYAQNPGPRFETPAEVRALAAVADLVGMTLAAECILMKEAGIAYAGLCIVDNLANGLEPRRLTMEEFHAGQRANRDRFVADLEAFAPRLASRRR